MQTLIPPPARRLDDLLVGVPGRARSLSEAGWVAATLLALGWLGSALESHAWSLTSRRVVLYACVAGVVVWAYQIVRPWRTWQSGRAASAALVTIALLPLALISAGGAGPGHDIVATVGEAGVSGLREAFRGTLLRNLALLAVLWLMLRADGQGLAAVGWDRRHLGRELRVALPAFALLVVCHVGVSMLVGLLALAFAGGSLQAEVGHRQVVAAALVSEQLPRMVLLILVASATEEIAFRGFLLPRLRMALGGWTPAVLAGAALFGAGHFYEGPLATVQTAAMGLVLGLIFVWRRQILACVLSHVSFNVLALLLFWMMTKLGVLERATELLKH
jgi:membrane protease YdiL (CAAX protease family)